MKIARLYVTIMFVLFTNEYAIYPDKKPAEKPSETYFTVLLPWVVSGGTEASQFPLYKPYSLAIDSKGNVYVLDVGNSCIVKYDKDGRFIKSWGSKGQGPGELGVSPRSLIRIDKKGNIVVTEGNNHRITFFDKGGKYLYSFQTERAPDSISFDSKNNIYTSIPGNSKNDKLIIKYDDKGNVLERFGQVIIEAYGPDYHISNLVHDEDDNLFQIFTCFPYMRKYDSKNNLKLQKEITLEGYFNEEFYKIWKNYNFSSPSNKYNNAWTLFCTKTLFYSNTLYLLNPGSVMKISTEGNYIMEKVFERGTPLKLGILTDFSIAPNGDIYTTFIGNEKVGIGVFIF